MQHNNFQISTKKITSEKKCEQNSSDEIFEANPINNSVNNSSFSGFDDFELGELIVGGSDDIAKDVNNSFVNGKSLNDDVVNNDSTAVYHAVVDNNGCDSLKNKFVNNFFSTDGSTLCDSVNTENTVNIESFGNITHNSNDTGIFMDDPFVLLVETPSDLHYISFVPSNAPTSLKTYLKRGILDFRDQSKRKENF